MNRHLRKIISIIEIIFLINVAAQYMNIAAAIIVGLLLFGIIELMADYGSDMVVFGKWQLPDKIKEYINKKND